MPKTLCFGKGGIERCISRFVRPSKMIREKDLNRPKTHNLDNLVLIAGDKKKIRRNSGVSNVYTFFLRILKVLIFTTQGGVPI